ncbi:MAG: hypothetical protein ACE5GX_20885, partial [Thermoanaerobaculia bacterium]
HPIPIDEYREELERRLGRSAPEPYSQRGTRMNRPSYVHAGGDLPETRRPGSGFHLWHDVIAPGEAIPPVRLAERESLLEMDDPINIQFTSGTTGGLEESS